MPRFFSSPILTLVRMNELFSRKFRLPARARELGIPKNSFSMCDFRFHARFDRAISILKKGVLDKELLSAALPETEEPAIQITWAEATLIINSRWSRIAPRTTARRALAPRAGHRRFLRFLNLKALQTREKFISALASCSGRCGHDASLSHHAHAAAAIGEESHLH